jgi:hypothetical protein
MGMKNKNILIILVLVIAILGIFLVAEKNIKNKKIELENNTTQPTQEIISDTKESIKKETPSVTAKFYCPKNGWKT